MAEAKLFVGPRIRRIRAARGLTQSAMAAALGVSPSYLNLIERNQRPLTVQLVLKLAAIYQVEPEELQGETRGVVGLLKEAFADPLLAGELPGDHELVELAQAAPNAASGLVKLYRAYREQAVRLSDLNALLAREGLTTQAAGARLPLDELRDRLEQRPNHFAALESHAEAFAAQLGPTDDLAAALKAWFRSAHHIAIRTLPVETMASWRRRYDRHSQRLFVSERLGAADRLLEIATEACLLNFEPALDQETAALDLVSPEARRLARAELARYAALALMMPYKAFHAAALRARYDIDVLAGRFNTSFEQAAHRLTTLQRAGASAVPFFLMVVDHAGNRFRRVGAQGFPASRFGGACPKLAVHAAFARPGQIVVEAVEMPDGAGFLTVSGTLDGPLGGFGERPRRTALLLGCDIRYRDEIAYGAALSASPPVGIGPVCRLCERNPCLSRAEPAVTRPLGLDATVSGLGPYDFQ